MRTLGFAFIFGLLRMKPWAVLLLIGMGAFAVDARAERMDLDCEEHLTDDLVAMACNIYWEGRNQGTEGMLGIAAVTMWRVRDPSYPDTIADVVWEKNWSKKRQRMIAMFSWTLDGKKDHPFKNEQEQWDEAWIIARNFAINAEQKDRMCPHILETQTRWNAMEENGESVERHYLKCEAYDQLLASKYYMMELVDPTGGAIMFHADYVNPWWTDSYYLSRTINDHLFYTKEPVAEDIAAEQEPEVIIGENTE